MIFLVLTVFQGKVAALNRCGEKLKIPVDVIVIGLNMSKIFVKGQF